VIEGPTLISEAVDAGAPVEVFRAPGVDDPVLARVITAGGRVHDLADGVLERITDTVTPQGMIATSPYRDVGLDDLLGSDVHKAPIVVLIDVRDPGNAGTILRSAESAGAAGVIACDGSVDLYNPKCVRASAGALFWVRHVRGGDPPDVIERLRSAGIRCLGAAAHGGTPPTRHLLKPPVALVVGNEAHGLPSAVADALDESVTIAVRGRAESLNVAMATTALLLGSAGLLDGGPE